jgi:hypothetical protein
LGHGSTEWALHLKRQYLLDSKEGLRETGYLNKDAKGKGQLEFLAFSYLINLFFENIRNATDKIPREKSKKEPVFTKTAKPNSTKPNANNPNLSLDIETPPE